ncbi:hypothetical protein OSH11_17130 [Kaistia dalseonensis]|uniref:Uncharacterized protein n=1 Tax=Kaistia dalseonensis TaxID=410840 RepID=A0ABU0H9R0_9HYPH|nr:hypothetical protein [Kaistia dalseonensis]MCX5496433.1 hypothetical protein [Kaistia dalseonensis]MDQ0439053.1 hypothetical protein [Kaistia dalseonensis]
MLELLRKRRVRLDQIAIEGALVRLEPAKIRIEPLDAAAHAFDIDIIARRDAFQRTHGIGAEADLLRECRQIIEAVGRGLAELDHRRRGDRRRASGGDGGEPDRLADGSAHTIAGAFEPVHVDGQSAQAVHHAQGPDRLPQFAQAGRGAVAKLGRHTKSFVSHDRRPLRRGASRWPPRAS